MSISPDRKYSATVEPGSQLWEAKTGSIAFRVQLLCEDGPCHHDIWLTGNTFERAEETFVEVLGVPKDKLRDGDFVANQLASVIVGRHLEFDTEEKDYNGNSSVVVKWLNRPGGKLTKADPTRLANFFLGQVAKPASDFPRQAPSVGPITDDDIPFRSRSPFWYSAWHENMPPLPRIKASRSVLRPSANGGRPIELLQWMHET